MLESNKGALGRGTVGNNREFWLLWTSLIFQVISWELDVNLLLRACRLPPLWRPCPPFCRPGPPVQTSCLEPQCCNYLENSWIVEDAES